MVAWLGYLGQVILAGGTYAALRDLAEYGATLCFDDAENLADPRKSDPDKRALLLAGNRKGAVVPVKKPEGKNGWRIRNVSAYWPKVFSVIRIPDPVLSSQTIVLPLVRSADPERANHDIEEDTHWSHDRRGLVDDLWIFGLHYLPAAKGAYERAGLTGPGFEPWRPLLATGVILEGAGVSDLVQRIRPVTTAYQSEKAEFEYPDATTHAVIAIAEIADVRTLSDVSDVLFQTPERLKENVRFTASTVATNINALAEDERLVDDGEAFTNSRKVGRILDWLRISRERNPAKKRTREWIISRSDVLKLLRAYAPSDVSEPRNTPTNKTSGTSKRPAMGMVTRRGASSVGTCSPMPRPMPPACIAGVPMKSMSCSCRSRKEPDWWLASKCAASQSRILLCLPGRLVRPAGACNVRRAAETAPFPESRSWPARGRADRPVSHRSRGPSDA